MKKNYLLSSIFGAMFMAMPVSADVIGMHTAAAVGENLTLALNQGVKATLTWGDGSTEEVTFNGGESKIVVKHADLTLTTEQAVLSLYCPDCSLTELNITEAPHLLTLTCTGNQLEKLDVSKSARLMELNCEDNLLKSLDLINCKALQTLNVSHNKLSTLNLKGLEDLTTLLCANNELTSLSMTYQKDLETLWCQGNKLKTLSFSSSAHPTQLCAFDNQLSSLKASSLSSVKELWVDNNKLEELDLSQAPTEVLSASDNLLSLIKLNNEKEAMDAMSAFYVDGNALMLNSLPSVYSTSTKDSLMSYNIDNQRPFGLAVASINIDDELDLRDYVRENAWGKITRAKVVWKDDSGKELVKGEDYKESSSRFRFTKPFNGIIGETTSVFYPETVLRFASLKVVDPTGIEDLASANDIEVSVVSNGVRIVSGVPTQVKIYNVSGALVVDEAISAGAYEWALPAGLYVVNGKKVVLSR